MQLNRIAARLTAALLLTSTLVTPTLALTGTVDTGTSVLRMRAEASANGTILKKLANGTQVEVLNTLDSGWYQVSYQDTTGYVSSDYLKLNNEDGTPVEADPAAVPAAASQETGETEAAYVRVISGPLNIRSGPSTDCDKVGKLYTGKIVEILGLQDGWYQIESGYINADYVAQADPSEVKKPTKGQEIVDYALQFVGYPYVYGGSSPKGFDCSGFTSYVYKHFGYSLNRSASGQLDNGKAVSMSQLQPGDLVIFKKSGTGSKRASHVGLYIGNNQFVHASTSKVGVIISSLSSSYYTTGFVGGRRIV